MSDQQVTASLNRGSVPPGLVEALARAVVALLSPPQKPLPDGAEDVADFLTAGEFARRLGVSRETVRRLAIADVLPHTVVCRGARQTTRRFPRRFADLCRRRHKSAYAEFRIMPTMRKDALVGVMNSLLLSA